MAENTESKELQQVLWDGANILRGKMDANEYKNYLLGIVFYKYLSDVYLVKAYDLLEDGKPDSMDEAFQVYEEAWNSDDREDLTDELKSELHYLITPELTFTKMVRDARENKFSCESLQTAFNNIEQADTRFANMFSDIDLYSTRLGVNDTKQAATVSDLVKAIDRADLLVCIWMQR